MRMTKRYHYFMAGLLWGFPGIMVTLRGMRAYSIAAITDWWWLMAITVGVLAFFYLIFGKVVTKYIAHIASLPKHSPFWRTFPGHTWAIIFCMSSLGIALRLISGIPNEFFASFYSGLGPMLIWSGVRFFRKL